jgi:glutamate formiminotransferase
MLECVLNVSEGHDGPELSAIVAAAADDLLDLHRDEHHNRAVLTVVGEDAPRRISRTAVERLDIRTHTGVHPRRGVVDVVPFVPLDGSTMDDAVAARDRFIEWAVRELALPCVVYGPERSLPDARRIESDAHPTAGTSMVGARPVLIAYNLWLAEPDLGVAKRIAASIRSPEVRALGFPVGSDVQVSCNLVAPAEVGPAEVYDLVAAQAPIARAELVGLVPASVLAGTPHHRWEQLDLGDDRAIEARLRR